MEIIPDEMKFWCSLFSVALFVFMCVMFDLLNKINNH
jgi:hypothetical protein